MEIILKHGDELIIKLVGRLDTTTSPELDKKIKEEQIEEKLVILDFSELEYISSAGLRILLALKKNLEASGKQLEIHNINAVVKEVFEVTGFINILNIK
jgi:anti-sigma B factor antagonist